MSRKEVFNIQNHIDKGGFATWTAHYRFSKGVNSEIREIAESESAQNCREGETESGIHHSSTSQQDAAAATTGHEKRRARWASRWVRPPAWQRQADRWAMARVATRQDGGREERGGTTTWVGWRIWERRWKTETFAVPSFC